MRHTQHEAHTNMQSDTLDEALNDAWRSAENTAVLYFLKRAIALDSTLEEIEAALSFEPVKEHLKNIRLGDILGSARNDQEAPEDHHKVRRPMRRVNKVAAAPVKRQRRSGTEIQAIKDLLLTRLQKIPAGVDTPRLAEWVNEAGHKIDTMKVNLLLNGLESSGHVQSDDGRPKTWRVKTQGRISAEPMVIKKAQASATNDHVQPTELLSQQEIQSAAAALRERFFASS